MRQEFHRGDLVFLRAEYWHDPELGGYAPQLLGVVRSPAAHGIVVGSYRDQYGGGPDQRHSYSILFLDDVGQPTYSSSWHHALRIEYLVQERCLETLDILDFYEEREERYYEEEDTDV